MKTLSKTYTIQYGRGSVRGQRRWRLCLRGDHLKQPNRFTSLVAHFDRVNVLFNCIKFVLRTYLGCFLSAHYYISRYFTFFSCTFVPYLECHLSKYGVHSKQGQGQQGTRISCPLCPHVIFLTYSFLWRIPLVILRYMAHLDSSNKLFFNLKMSIEKTALVTQNHHFQSRQFS